MPTPCPRPRHNIVIANCPVSPIKPASATPDHSLLYIGANLDSPNCNAAAYAVAYPPPGVFRPPPARLHLHRAPHHRPRQEQGRRLGPAPARRRPSGRACPLARAASRLSRPQHCSSCLVGAAMRPHLPRRVAAARRVGRPGRGAVGGREEVQGHGSVSGHVMGTCLTRGGEKGMADNRPGRLDRWEERQCEFVG